MGKKRAEQAGTGSAGRGGADGLGRAGSGASAEDGHLRVLSFHGTYGYEMQQGPSAAKPFLPSFL